MASKVWKAFLTLSPVARLVAVVVTLALSALLVLGVYKGLWYVFGGREAIKAHAETQVAQVHADSTTQAGQTATSEVIKRYEYHTEVDKTVEKGQQGVDNAYHGETVGNDVDAAGAAALCSLDPSLCRVRDNQH